MLLPRYASVQDIQKNYHQLFNQVKKTRKPLLVLKNNRPEVAVITVDQLEKLAQTTLQNLELQDALAAIKTGEEELAKNQLIEADSLLDLI
jgi:prevent-host-death family protein